MVEKQSEAQFLTSMNPMMESLFATDHYRAMRRMDDNEGVNLLKAASAAGVATGIATTHLDLFIYQALKSSQE